jgi:DNA-binding GntR family transcriptional regulator
MPNAQGDLNGRAPTSADIADWIRERIRRGRFVPEQRLVEVDIIRQTGGSRAKVREAFQRLAADGLVLIEEFRGASVRTASLAEVKQIYRARAALEGVSARDFTLKATEEMKQRLLSLHKELDACVKARANDRFGQLNNQWHRLLVQGSGNLVIDELLQRLNVPIHRLLFESFYHEDRLKIAHADHDMVLQAILDGDADAAEANMRRHIDDGFVTLTVIETEVFGAGASSADALSG